MGKNSYLNMRKGILKLLPASYKERAKSVNREVEEKERVKENAVTVAKPPKHECNNQLENNKVTNIPAIEACGG